MCSQQPTALEMLNVGSGSEELNGTYDMMGNVWKWMKSPYHSEDYSSDSGLSFRGGAYYYLDDNLSSSYRFSFDPYVENSGVGFRIASNIPKPCTLVLLLGGSLMLQRRRK